MTVDEFAMEQGFTGAEFLKTWHGFKCYEPYYEKGKIMHIGQPVIILEKNNKIRLANEKEVFKILK